tara:strand:+ start:47 stop:391 length:345 start_codon:yes stop_codon:yes gene_type:complete
MGFILKQSDTFSWPVTFDLPVDGGLHETQAFDVQFKRMPQKWIREIAKKIDADKVTDTEVAKEILSGWAGITDESGKEIPFSQKTMEQLLEIPTLSGSVVLAFFKATAGVKEKN